MAVVHKENQKASNYSFLVYITECASQPPRSQGLSKRNLGYEDEIPNSSFS